MKKPIVYRLDALDLPGGADSGRGEEGAIDALKKSTALLRKTWGEQLVSGAGFGMVFFLLALPGILIMIGGFALGVKAGFVFLALGVLYLMLLSLVHATLQTIFEAALYVYAEKGEAPAGFGNELLSGALVSK